MSNKPYHHIVYGVKIPQEQFPGDFYDDQWLPYTEGHEGVEMGILQGDEHLYCGKILARTDPYGDDQECISLELDEETKDRISQWIKDTFNWSDPPQLMLVCIWL